MEIDYYELIGIGFILIIAINIFKIFEETIIRKNGIKTDGKIIDASAKSSGRLTEVVVKIEYTTIENKQIISEYVFSGVLCFDFNITSKIGEYVEISYFLEEPEKISINNMNGAYITRLCNIIILIILLYSLRFA